MLVGSHDYKLEITLVFLNNNPTLYDNLRKKSI